MYHLNTELREQFQLPAGQNLVSRWIYTEAQTGKGRLDTHFSFLNTQFLSFGTDMTTETDIFKALCFQGGLVGTTAILLDAQNLGTGKVLQNSKEFKAKTGVRATHEIQWNRDAGTFGATVITLSGGLTKPEHIKVAKLATLPKRNLEIPVKESFTSEKPALFIHDKVDEGEEAATADSSNTGTMSSKASVFAVALDQAGIESGGSAVEASPSEFETAARTHASLEAGWACYPKQVRNADLSVETLELLKKLYDLGNQDKSKRISADRAHVIVVEEVAARDWYEQLICTVPRIKVFFGMSKAKMKKLIEERRGAAVASRGSETEGGEESVALAQAEDEELEAVVLDEGVEEFGLSPETTPHALAGL